MDNYTVEATPGELLIGRLSHNFVLPDDYQELKAKCAEAAKYGLHFGAGVSSTGHRVLDFEKLLGKGAKSIIADIDRKLAELDYTNPDDAEKDVFYRASKMSLEGLCRFAKRANETLNQLADAESDPQQAYEYSRMAKNFEKAPYEPCTSFYEAIQIEWFLQFTMQILGDTALAGRIDNYLYPFYKNDIENGVITKEFASELIQNLFLKHNEIYGTWPGSLMVGGVDKNGDPVWNDITELCIEAIEETGLINPSVSVAYTEDMPDALLEKCIDVIGKGYTKPSIFNDRIVRAGLERAGVTEEDARVYIHSTCVEITPVGKSNILVATPYINPTKALEYVLGKGKPLFGGDCGVRRPITIENNDTETFDSFYATVKKVFAEIIRGCILDDCYHSLRRKRYMSCPLSSALIDDCIETGKDAGAGGAKYNFIYPCFPGYVTLVDSLAAIKKAVYSEGKITLAELETMCTANFENEERMRQYLINKCEKFGNGYDDVDEIAADLYDFINDELAKYKHSIENTGTFHPSYFAWIMHGVLGKNAAATPNGRRQGEALSENLGASQGMDKNSPIGVVRSISKLEQEYGIGGIATNFRFSKSLMTSNDGKQAVMNFIRYFMESDCFEVQFNVIDQATLIDAKAHPENYATLMVRVAGYSDYFTNLAPEIQNEIIQRTEHSVI
jgi:formate C-acetyltransferase